MSIKKIFQIFKKDKENPILHWRIEYSDIAKLKGSFDKFNLVLNKYYGDRRLEETIPYSKEDVKAITEIDKIPVVWGIKEEKVQIEQIGEQGQVTIRR